MARAPTPTPRISWANTRARARARTHIRTRIQKTHLTHTHTTPPPKENMDEYHRRVCKRKTKPSDWNDACEYCAAADGTNAVYGRLFKCKFCNVVAHKQCIESQHNDLPTHKDDHWTCPECAREINEVKHNSSCLECNESEFINDDIMRAIKLLESLEQRRAGDPMDGGEGGGEGGEEEGRRAATDSEMLRARLADTQRKEAEYHAHLIRDKNQAMYKGIHLAAMSICAFYVLADYWAKLVSPTIKFYA